MNLPVPVAFGIWIVIGVALLLVVLLGRRRLAQRTRTTVPAPPAPPADPAALGALRAGPFEGTYVSTTLAGDWLARVGAHHLGDRSTAVVRVHDAGVVVERGGAPDLLVPTAALLGAGTAPGMAGKFVGPDGLVVVSWEAPAAGDAPAAALDTGLRLRRADDRPLLLDAVRDLLPGADAPGAATAAPTDPKDTP